MRQKVVTKVVKKWLFKYHFSIKKNPIVIGRSTKACQSINQYFLHSHDIPQNRLHNSILINWFVNDNYLKVVQ